MVGIRQKLHGQRQHADKVVIEKVDYSNHLGTLDIDRLEGQLNIGANSLGVRKTDEPLPAAADKPGPPQAPQYRIRPRTKKDRPVK
jgi:hypothetical protein